jgi:endogenous inhibitor of DNA gyrase (YacG/DUF329 family)
MTGAVRDTDSFARQVDCPACGGLSLYAPSNVYRPFCSERCKQSDLGAWASEQFALPEPVDRSADLSDH